MPRLAVVVALCVFAALPHRASAQASPPAVEAIAFGPTEVRVYWDALPGATGYRVLRDGQELGTSAADATRYTDSTAVPNHTYRYSVQAIGVAPAGAPPAQYVERTYPVLPDETRCDVLVVGATTGGVAAAITAARYGLNVVLTEETRRLGGMPVNGLGSTDLRRPYFSSGMFEEFRRHVQALYGKGDGLRYEPRVAHQAMKEMLWAEPRLTVYRELRPVKVVKQGSAITEVIEEEVKTGRRVTFRPKLVVDASDTGDVAAWAGAPFRLGREARSPREPHAGYIFYDRTTDKALPGSTGRGDYRVQAYAYLMTVKDYGPGADKTIPMPAGYDPREYEHAPKWEQSWAVTSGKLPSDKYEVNQHPQGSDLQEVNYRYAVDSYAERRRIEQLYRNHALGYLYYIQTVQGHKNIGLSDDDYRDNDNWPQLLYIREARRFEADRVIDEAGITNRPLRADAIGLGEYPMDSHAVQRKTDWSTPDLGEGEFYLPQWTPWHQMPYHIMIPKRLSNVFVPTAVSATHVAYGTLRLEPGRMHFGEAAGIAAYLCLRYGVTPREVPARQIQSELLKHDMAPPGQSAMDGIGAPGPSAHPALLYTFSDVQPGERRYNDVMWLAARGFYPAPPPEHNGPVAGLARPAFEPNAPETDADAARLLALLPPRGDRWLHGAETGRQSGQSEIQYRKSKTENPLTRRACARLLAGFVGWTVPPGERRGPHYADIPSGDPDFAAVEGLYDHWIDSRLWDGTAAFAPEGRLYFRPDEPVTRAQFAELVHLSSLYFGPLWDENPVDAATE